MFPYSVSLEGGRATTTFRLVGFNFPEMDIFRAYIVLFNLEKNLIVTGSRPEMMPIGYKKFTLPLNFIFHRCPRIAPDFADGIPAAGVAGQETNRARRELWDKTCPHLTDRATRLG